MSHFSKRAQELIDTYGTTTNIRRLNKEMRAKKKAEKDLKLADKNITQILLQVKKRKKKKY